MRFAEPRRFFRGDFDRRGRGGSDRELSSSSSSSTSMKPPSYFLTALVLVSISGALSLCSCLSPQARDLIKAAVPVVIPLTQAVEASGNLPPGSSVLIEQTTAVITSADSKEVKLMKLKDIGVDAAMKDGLIQEGDKLLVDQTGAALVKLTVALEESMRPPAEAPPVNPILPPAQP